MLGQALLWFSPPSSPEAKRRYVIFVIREGGNLLCTRDCFLVLVALVSCRLSYLSILMQQRNWIESNMSRIHGKKDTQVNALTFTINMFTNSRDLKDIRESWVFLLQDSVNLWMVDTINGDKKSSSRPVKYLLVVSWRYHFFNNSYYAWLDKVLEKILSFLAAWCFYIMKVKNEWQQSKRVYKAYGNINLHLANREKTTQWLQTWWLILFNTNVKT